MTQIETIYKEEFSIAKFLENTDEKFEGNDTAFHEYLSGEIIPVLNQTMLKANPRHYSKFTFSFAKDHQPQSKYTYLNPCKLLALLQKHFQIQQLSFENVINEDKPSYFVLHIT